MNFKKNKGITLIALVITIVIMLILAAVTINLTLGKNGIVGKARDAAELQNSAAREENLRVILSDAKSERLIYNSINFSEFLKSKGATEVFEEETSYTVEYYGVNYIVDKETYEILDKAKKVDIKAIASISLGFNDLISSTELKITPNIQYNQGKSATIDKYRYFVYKGSNLIASNTTTENNWTATGLTVGDKYNIYVVVTDNEGGSFKSQETEYTKKEVYFWNKYAAEQGNLINYTYTRSGASWQQTADNTFQSNTDYQIVSNIATCFDSTTGTWTADSVINSETGYQKIGWKLILRGNKVIDLTGMTNYGNHNGMYLVPYCVYTSVPNYEYHKGSDTPIGDPVTSNDPNAYPTQEGGGYKNGYWYIKIAE